jgi:hypothetical protein
MLMVIATLLLASPPAGFTVVRDTVKIAPAVWYDADGQKHVTEQPCLQVRLTVTNEADHPVRWPGFHRARVTYGGRQGNTYVGGAVLPAALGPDCRWENSLLTGQVLNPKQKTTILVVFDRPRTPGAASLELQWKGETPGWNMTVKSGFQLPKGT